MASDDELAYMPSLYEDGYRSVQVKAPPIIVLALLCVTSVQAQQPQPGPTPPPTPPATQQQPAPGLVDENSLTGTSARASKLIGAKVYRGADSVGEIKDVLVDLDHATVPAVILSISGLLGMNEKLVAVPPAMIKVGKEAHFTVDFTEDQLKAAPAFDPSKL